MSESTALNEFAGKIYALAERSEADISAQTIKSRLTRPQVVEAFRKRLSPPEQSSADIMTEVPDEAVDLLRSWRRIYRKTLEMLDEAYNTDSDSAREMLNARKRRGIDPTSDPVQVALDDWAKFMKEIGLLGD